MTCSDTLADTRAITVTDTIAGAVTESAVEWVSRAAWQRDPARSGAIDEIADQFERPDSLDAAVAWPQRPSAWRVA